MPNGHDRELYFKHVRKSLAKEMEKRGHLCAFAFDGLVFDRLAWVASGIFLSDVTMSRMCAAQPLGRSRALCEFPINTAEFFGLAIPIYP